MTTQIPAKEKSRLAYHSRMKSMTIEESLAFKKRRAEYFRSWYEKKTQATAQIQDISTIH
jgi:hypothetical protein